MRAHSSHTLHVRNNEIIFLICHIERILVVGKILDKVTSEGQCVKKIRI